MQNRNQHFGSCFYIGQKAKSLQSIPIPSGGPREYGWWYYQRYINHFCWPFVLGLYNRLGCTASRMDFYIYKHLAVLFPANNTCLSKIRYCQLLIATINFECINHIKQCQKIENDLQIIIDDADTSEEMHNKADSTTEKIRSWVVAVPTTCCYQFVVSDGLRKEKWRLFNIFDLLIWVFVIPLKITDQTVSCFSIFPCNICCNLQN